MSLATPSQPLFGILTLISACIQPRNHNYFNCQHQHFGPIASHVNVACRSYVDGAFYRLSQAITLSLTGGFAIFWFKTGLFAKLTCDGRDRLIDAINLARKEGRVIITYSNHRSTIDDPGIMPCLVPSPAPTQPNIGSIQSAQVPPHWLLHPPYMRWGLCAEDVCFGVNDFVSTYFGAGKALPVCRGGGIGQAEMRVLESKFAPVSLLLLPAVSFCNTLSRGAGFTFFLKAK